ncbi:hypothetical protein FB639_005256, partial [Coemansia asiatica]
MSAQEQLNDNVHTPQHNMLRDSDAASRQRQEGSLSVESNKSYRSMITPSPEPMAQDNVFSSAPQQSNNSTSSINGDTLAHVYSMDDLNLENDIYNGSLVHS